MLLVLSKLVLITVGKTAKISNICLLVLYDISTGLMIRQKQCKDAAPFRYFQHFVHLLR